MGYDRLTALDASFLHLERTRDADARGRAQRVRGRAVLRRRRSLPPRRRPRARGLAAPPHPAVPQAARCPSRSSRAGRSGSTTTASTSATTCASPRCRSPGTASQLLALTERVQAQLLDRSRPLWELWFVEGLEGGHVGAHPEDAPRARRRGLGRRRRHRAARLRARAAPSLERAASGRPSPRPTRARLLVDTLVRATDRSRPRSRGRVRRVVAGHARACASRRSAAAQPVATLVDRQLARAPHLAEHPVGRRAPPLRARPHPARRRQARSASSSAAR